MTRKQKVKLKEALFYFKQGDFNESQKLLAELITELPGNLKALTYAGYIALLENRLKDATKILQKALEIKPKSATVRHLLADTYYRQDDFVNAFIFMNTVNRKLHAAKFDYLRNNNIYQITSPVNKVELAFVVKDPLPLVKVSINGADPVNFLLDTGGGELIIDASYAKSLGLKEFGSGTDVFGDGKKGTYTLSSIDFLQLGELQLGNIPVMLLDTKSFSRELFRDKFHINGILGTCIFYHFLTTLDYAEEKVVFEVTGKDAVNALQSRLQTESFSRVPFWMVEHLMTVKGEVNGSTEMLFLIDTGLAGMSFTCPRSTLKKGNIPLKKDKTVYGVGAGGRIKLVPFEIESLRLGNVVERNLHGVYGPFPQLIEHSLGFRIGGLISHEFFRNHTLIFDYSSMMLFIK